MNVSIRSLMILLLMAQVVFAVDGVDSLPAAATRDVDFDQDILPIFKTRCYACHDAAKQRGGFRLDRKSAAMKGGESFAPDIRPGHSAESPIVKLVAGLEDGMLMPPEGDRLTAEQIGLLRAWIDQGAKWSDTLVSEDANDHWSFRPVVRPIVPEGSRDGKNWNRNVIDAFVAARLANDTANSVLLSGGRKSPGSEGGVSEGIKPGDLRPPLRRTKNDESGAEFVGFSVEADRVTLIRRLSFDLLGLPPTPEEAAEFVVDSRPDAYERLVDRFLASPHFGERWARHWLDVVRFAESDGFETNQPRPNAWPYRDYVIRAFNEDIPYEQFVTEQLAGDASGVDEATGFIVGGSYDRVKSPDPALTAQQRADELHDMVSTTGSAFLGLTVGCARCHNHKFDPISQTDYYGMKAIFAGVQHGDRPLKPADAESRERKSAALKLELAKIDQSLRAFEPMAFVPIRPATSPSASRQPTTLLLDDDTSQTAPDMPSVTQLVPRLGLEPHRSGTGRGQANDPGDARRLPNLGRNYSYWRDVANKDVFSWNPRLSGTFRVWVSWGCGWQTHAPDARYVLDLDGDVATKDDQREIARVDQRRFADGTGGNEQQPLWSGFYDAGVHSFDASTRLILRGGDTDAYVTTDLICLQQVGDVRSRADDGKSMSVPSLRASVHRQTNVERFAPTLARYLRFTIDQTNTGAQPCIDELEVFTSESSPRNVARDATPTSSSNLPGYEIHQLKHINDGRYGNAASWISNEAGRGWVVLEFPQPVEIDRVLWSRDRIENGQFTDRIPTKYRIEAGLTLDVLSLVATSDDRIPVDRNLTTLATRTGLTEHEQIEASEATRLKSAIEQQLKDLANSQQVYAGRFGGPEPTYRFHRGDPLQPREPVAPAGLASFASEFKLPLEAEEALRRLRLAEWITDRSHPLTARVFVNRLWHSHFGQGLVTTPSDFGRNGAKPSHPELLDWLASEVSRGQARPDGTIDSTNQHAKDRSSPKRLHRLIVTSATYRQKSTARPEGMQVDAGSRLLWRYPPRRLEAEPLRDAILSICGNLDDRMGGPGFDLFEPNTNYVKVYNSRREFGPAEWRRMVYQSKPRMQLDDTFGPFDCPDAGQITPKRTSSITALQALNLLNSNFISQQCALFAKRLQDESGTKPEDQIHRAFRLAFLRSATLEEVAMSTEFIERHGLTAFCRAVLNANEFLFVF